MSSSGTAPPPPATFQVGRQGEAAENAFSAIGGLENMPNMPQQVFNATSGSLAPVVGASSGYDPAGTVATGDNIGALPQEYLSFARNLFNEGFDPQGDVYGRAAHNLTEQIRASQGARGIQTSPYGAGLEDEAMGNFNIDWENNKLSRMSTAMNTALPAFGQAGAQMGYGENVKQSAPALQGNLAQLLSPVGTAAYTQPQMAVGDWLNYVGAGNNANNVTAQNYAAQVASYQAQQQAAAAANSAWGDFAGNVAGASISKWG